MGQRICARARMVVARCGVLSYSGAAYIGVGRS